jgi:hypothetical protein
LSARLRLQKKKLSIKPEVDSKAEIEAESLRSRATATTEFRDQIFNLFSVIVKLKSHLLSSHNGIPLGKKRHRYVVKYVAEL